jgi:hypothetical protein
MSYLGSTPASQFFAPGTDTFSGTGSQTAFTLSRNVATVNDILVVVNNVDQQPTAYTVASNILTFTAAPSSGTNNIYVRYLSTNLQSIVPQQGSVTPASLSTPNALYWDTNSNVSIGTTTPIAPLTLGNSKVVGWPNSTGGFNGTTLGTQIFKYSDNNLYIDNLDASTSTIFRSNGNAERMRIDSSGNVGIGGDNPGAYGKLGVLGSGYQAAYVQSNDASGVVSILASNSSSETRVGSISNHPLYFMVNGDAKARIDTSGNLLINTTSMPAGYSKLAFRCNGDGSTWQNLGATGASAPTTLAFLNSAGTRVGYIAQSGTGTAFTSTSDYRLKEDVQPMVGALDKVAQLKPCTYKWKSTGGDGQGFIAHELQAVVPDCVNGEKDAVDADGNPNYQGVDTSFLVATLTAAIQEQQAMIEELKTKVAALEAR